MALDAAFVLAPTAEERWQAKFQVLFSDLRNPVVHHKESSRDLAQQAAGIQTPPEMGEWDARRSSACVDLLLEVMEECGAASAKGQRFTASREELATNSDALKRLRR